MWHECRVALGAPGSVWMRECRAGVCMCLLSKQHEYIACRRRWPAEPGPARPPPQPAPAAHHPIGPHAQPLRRGVQDPLVGLVHDLRGWGVGRFGGLGGWVRVEEGGRAGSPRALGGRLGGPWEQAAAPSLLPAPQAPQAPSHPSRAPASRPQTPACPPWPGRPPAPGGRAGGGGRQGLLLGRGALRSHGRRQTHHAGSPAAPAGRRHIRPTPLGLPRIATPTPQNKPVRAPPARCALQT
jgi:hypothetical protein